MPEPIIPPAGQVPPVVTTPAPAFDPTVLNTLQGDSFKSIFPEEFRAKPYLKDVNTFGDFLKKFDGAQTLIGQRSAPADTATPEEWNNFFTKLGRPEKPEGYQIPEIQGVPKEFVDKASEIGILKQIMHQAGMNPYQAKVFASGFLKNIYDAELAEKKVEETKFSEFMDKTFGQNKVAIFDNGKKYLNGVLPENIKPLIEGLDEKSLAVVLAATEGIVKKHVSEDGFRGVGSAPTGQAPRTKETIAGDMRNILAQKEYSDPFLNKTKHGELKQQMERLREELRKMS